MVCFTASSFILPYLVLVYSVLFFRFDWRVVFLSYLCVWFPVSLHADLCSTDHVAFIWYKNKFPHLHLPMHPAAESEIYFSFCLFDISGILWPFWLAMHQIIGLAAFPFLLR